MSTIAAAERRDERESRRWAGPILLVVVVAGLQFLIAFAAAGRPAQAMQIVAALVLLTAALVYPRLVLVLALVATALPQRVGPEAFDLSIADAYMVLALVAALRFVPWQDRRIRLVMGALVIYLGTLAVSLTTHHSQKAIFEFAHRGVLFGGAVLVGVAIVQSGVTRQALRAFMVVVGVIATAAVVQTVTNGFSEAYPLQLQKNHAGLLLAAGFLVAFAARRHLGWSPRVTNLLAVLMLLGLAATQSRAAALGLAVALAVRPLLLGRTGNQRTVSIGAVVLCLALLGLTALSINENDLSRPEAQQRFNSINTRTDTFQIALKEVWRPSPIVGGGLRWFTEPTSPTIAPHNPIISEVSEVGVIGLAGLMILLGATALALRRSLADLALLGMMALILRVTQGMAEIFWVAGPFTAAFILVGLGLTGEPGTDDREGEGSVSMRERSSTLGGFHGLN